MNLGMNIPAEQKLDVYTRMAEIQACHRCQGLGVDSSVLIFRQIDLFHIRLPRIGKVVGINEDGTYRMLHGSIWLLR